MTPMPADHGTLRGIYRRHGFGSVAVAVVATSVFWLLEKLGIR